MTQDYFSGRERIAIFEPSGRPTRMGDPAELAVSNHDRVQQALAAGDTGKAAEYAALQFESNAAMLTIYSQWPCAYLLAGADLLGAAAARQLAAKAFEHWRNAQQSLAPQGETERTVLTRAESLLHPDLLTPAFAQEVIDAFRSGQTPDYGAVAREMLKECETRLSASLARDDIPETRQAYAAYFSCARSWHDALMQYADSFPSVAATMFGQASAEALVEKSFNLAPFGSGLWAFGTTCPPCSWPPSCSPISATTFPERSAKARLNCANTRTATS